MWYNRTGQGKLCLKNDFFDNNYSIPQNIDRYVRNIGRKFGEFPYIAHGAQITQPPLHFYFFLVFMLFLGKARLS